MNHTKDQICTAVRPYTDRLFDTACDIFDHPELALKEFYACEKLERLLREYGFEVEHGVGGLETAFRATWSNGDGGPIFGFMLEYDALPEVGHACGHHLQGPACIGAALAIRDLCTLPCTLVLYGTPAEEGRGGKIDMLKNGCFRECDILFCYHSGIASGVGSANKALCSTRIAIHGIGAHAAAHPEKGRSALDTLMLAFHGLEIMREHVPDGCRIHYTISAPTGPASIVHESATALIMLRSPSRKNLSDMIRRMKLILDGACTMCETTWELVSQNSMENIIMSDSLRKLILSCEDELGSDRILWDRSTSGGSSDVGNVSQVVPVANVYTYFCDGRAHSQVWADEGKKPIARRSMENASEVIAMTALRLLHDSQLLQIIQEEHKTLMEHEA